MKNHLFVRCTHDEREDAFTLALDCHEIRKAIQGVIETQNLLKKAKDITVHAVEIQLNFVPKTEDSSIFDEFILSSDLDPEEYDLDPKPLTKGKLFIRIVGDNFCFKLWDVDYIYTSWDIDLPTLNDLLNKMESNLEKFITDEG